MSFADIVAGGNRASIDPRETHRERQRAMPGNSIHCRDGFTMSVIAGWGCYCTPRLAMFSGYPFGAADRLRMYSAPHDYPGPYTEVEVGFPSERPEPWPGVWHDYAEDPTRPTGTVYPYVPVAEVAALIELHGGEEGVDPEMMCSGTQAE